MYSFFFGEAPKRLYGAYDAPTGRGGTALVVAPGWGPEYLAAHKVLRTLARRASEKGIHAMRFDYYGTGDSMGDDREVSVESLQDDLRLAVQECLDVAEVEEVWLVGVRLGATIAAVSAPTLDAVRGVVLWDPLIRGRDFLREIEGSATTRSGDAWDVGGYELTSTARAQIETLELPPATSDPVLGHPSFVVCHGDNDVGARAEQAGYTVVRYKGPRPWVEVDDFGNLGMAVDAIGEVVKGVGGGA